MSTRLSTGLRRLRAAMRRGELARDLAGHSFEHQRFVGTGYFDDVAQVVAGGMSSTVALAESTEAEQFGARG